MNRQDSPDLPAQPEAVSLAQDRLREAGTVTQTHCVVTWVIASALGVPLFMHTTSTAICRSDGGEITMTPPDMTGLVLQRNRE